MLRKKARFQLPLQLRPNVKNEEKPTRKIQRGGKVKGLTTTTSEWDGEGSGKRDTNKTVAVTCGYSRLNCEREFTQLVTFEVTFEVFE
jgi:hypothetical protein